MCLKTAEWVKHTARFPIGAGLTLLFYMYGMSSKEGGMEAARQVSESPMRQKNGQNWRSEVGITCTIRAAAKATARVI
jgi:hypothetical protein